MRGVLLVTLLLATALAGCAQPAPQGMDMQCPPGEFATGATSSGSLRCSPPRTAFSCERGMVVTGFDGRGEPVCRDIFSVAREGEESYARYETSQPSKPARTLALSSSGALHAESKTYTVAAASPGLRWSDLTFTLNGELLSQDLGTACVERALATKASFRVCGGSRVESPSESVDAGDQLSIYAVGPGETLRVLDSDANAVILTLTVG